MTVSGSKYRFSVVPVKQGIQAVCLRPRTVDIKFQHFWSKVKGVSLREKYKGIDLMTLLYAESISVWSNQGSVMCLLSILNLKK